MNILLVEIDRSSSKAIVAEIEKRKIHAVLASSVEEGYEIAASYDLDMILLGPVMLEACGSVFLRKIRDRRVGAPVVALSGRIDMRAMLKFFALGGDDYVGPKACYDELFARILAVHRRTKGHARSIVQVGDLVLDIDAQSVSINGKEVRLTVKEYQILEILTLRKGATVHRDTFQNKLYPGVADPPDTKGLEVSMHRLRKKIYAVSGGVNYIYTDFGYGYALIKDARRPRKPH